jgi:hypothetical protein
MNRVYVNQLCRYLAAEGLIVRQRGSDGKLVSVLAGWWMSFTPVVWIRTCGRLIGPGTGRCGRSAGSGLRLRASLPEWFSGIGWFTIGGVFSYLGLLSGPLRSPRLGWLLAVWRRCWRCGC